MAFHSGDEVEICSKEDGFLGSYYAATVVSRLDNINMYVVKYKELLENDESGPLIETLFNNEVRPVPPHDQIRVRATGFAYIEKVDAFDNDGWWMGTITGKEGPNYKVHFETTGDEIAYHLSRLWFHLVWRHGKWVFPTKPPTKLLLFI